MRWQHWSWHLDLARKRGSLGRREKISGSRDYYNNAGDSRKLWPGADPSNALTFTQCLLKTNKYDIDIEYSKDR
jgi:hypothetical protein